MTGTVPALKLSPVPSSVISFCVYSGYESFIRYACQIFPPRLSLIFSVF